MTEANKPLRKIWPLLERINVVFQILGVSLAALLGVKFRHALARVAVSLWPVGWFVLLGVVLLLALVACLVLHRKFLDERAARVAERADSDPRPIVAEALSDGETRDLTALWQLLRASKESGGFSRDFGEPWEREFEQRLDRLQRAVSSAGPFTASREVSRAELETALRQLAGELQSLGEPTDVALWWRQIAAGGPPDAPQRLAHAARTVDAGVDALLASLRTTAINAG